MIVNESKSDNIVKKLVNSNDYKGLLSYLETLPHDSILKDPNRSDTEYRKVTDVTGNKSGWGWRKSGKRINVYLLSDSEIAKMLLGKNESRVNESSVDSHKGYKIVNENKLGGKFRSYRGYTIVEEFENVIGIPAVSSQYIEKSGKKYEVPSYYASNVKGYIDEVIDNGAQLKPYKGSKIIWS